MAPEEDGMGTLPRSSGTSSLSSQEGGRTKVQTRGPSHSLSRRQRPSRKQSQERTRQSQQEVLFRKKQRDGQAYKPTRPVGAGGHWLPPASLLDGAKEMLPFAAVTSGLRMPLPPLYPFLVWRSYREGPLPLPR